MEETNPEQDNTFMEEPQEEDHQKDPLDQGTTLVHPEEDHLEAVHPEEGRPCPFPQPQS
jgi:hypothetical protein